MTNFLQPLKRSCLDAQLRISEVWSYRFALAVGILGIIPILPRRGKNILYSAFAERPKHLDPVQSYSSNEILFTAQIYEPPLQYHYLKRPVRTDPFAASELPEAQYFDHKGNRLPDMAMLHKSPTRFMKFPSSPVFAISLIRLLPGTNRGSFSITSLSRGRTWPASIN